MMVEMVLSVKIGEIVGMVWFVEIVENVLMVRTVKMALTVII